MASNQTTISDKSRLSSLEAIKLRRTIAKSRRRQEAYIDTIKDAVLLAVNQVQDKRIELLEQGPEVSTTEVLFDILLSVALSSAVAGKIIGAATKALLRPVLRTRAAFVALPKTDIGIIVRNQTMVSGIRSAENIELTKEFLRTTDTSRLYKDVVYRVTEGIGDIAGKIPKAVVGAGLLSEAPPVHIGDTAGVGVLDMVQTWATRQNQANNLAHDYFDIEIQTDTINRSAAEMLRNFLENELILPGQNIEFQQFLKEKSLANLKERYKYFYETCIWAQLFNIEIKFKALGVTSLIDLATGNEVPDRLVQYWIRRFRRPASNKIESFYEWSDRTTPTHIGSGPEEAIVRNAIGELGKHLKKLNKEIGSAQKTVGVGIVIERPLVP